jgi:hypothetical protein
LQFCEHSSRQPLQQRDLTRQLIDYADGFRDGVADQRSFEPEEPQGM